MKKITSVSDFLNKSEKDCKYKWLLICTFGGGVFINKNGIPIKYKDALEWLNHWILKNVGNVNSYYPNCFNMVNYINIYIPTVENLDFINNPPTE